MCSAEFFLFCLSIDSIAERLRVSSQQKHGEHHERTS
ncbi:hypothetical protein EMIT0215P_290017 [Pseudomonas serboccidentalis]